MRVEKIIKRDDGSRIKLDVSVGNYNFQNKFKYDIYVSVCKKGKRTFTGSYSSDSFSYRCLNHDDRQKYILESQLKLVSEKEIYDAQIELWQMLEPVLISSLV